MIWNAPGHRSTGARLGLSVLLIGLVSVALAACGSSSSSGKGTLVIYSAQHPETTAAIVAAFTKQTGIKVQLKNDDEDVLTAQIEQEGQPLAGRRVLHRELQLAAAARRSAACWPQSPRRRSRACPRRDSATNGDWLGVSGRFSVLIYNPTKISAAQLPTRCSDLADPRYKGKLELAPAETDFWPVISSVARQGSGRRAGLAEGAEGKRRLRRPRPRQRDARQRRQQGRSADMGLINHYYYYRIRSEMGAGSFHAKLAYFAPRDPGYVEDISGARRFSSRAAPGGGAAVPRVHHQPAGPARDRPQRQLEYPLAPGVAANSELPPLSTLKPNSFTPAELGTGLDAKNLLQRGRI